MADRLFANLTLEPNPKTAWDACPVILLLAAAWNGESKLNLEDHSAWSEDSGRRW